MTKTERRVQRTREMLQNALIELIDDRAYDGITVQDIVDRANVGRTTFYLHYNSKDDLFVSCHETIVSDFHLGPLSRHPLSREELLSPQVPPGTTAAYRHLEDAWVHLHPIFRGKDGPLILRRIREWSAEEIEGNLRVAFTGAESTIPLEVLANFLAGAQTALLQWWLEKLSGDRARSHKAEDVAGTYHRLQRAAIREAFGI